MRPNPPRSRAEPRTRPHPDALLTQPSHQGPLSCQSYAQIPPLAPRGIIAHTMGGPGEEYGGKGVGLLLRTRYISVARFRMLWGVEFYI